MISCPVHCPSGCRNSSHNHNANGFSAFKIEDSTFKAADIKSKAAGTAFSNPHFAIGRSTSLRNHKSNSPIAFTMGRIFTNTPSKDTRSGEKSRVADHVLISPVASRKNPVTSSKRSPRWRMISRPVFPLVHASSNPCAKFPTVYKRLEIEIRTSSVTAFP